VGGEAEWSLVVGVSGSALSLLLCLGSAELASLEDGGGGELDVLLRAHSDQVAGDVHELLADGNVSLSDEHSGVVDGVGELSLGDEGLESSLHDLGEGESQDVIELFLVLLQHSESDHSSDKGITFNIIVNLFNNRGKNKNIPSKTLLGSFSSKVSKSLAAFLHKEVSNCELGGVGSYLIFARVNWILQTSLLFFKP
jgi:hypothetical protein